MDNVIASKAKQSHYVYTLITLMIGKTLSLFITSCIFLRRKDFISDKIEHCIFLNPLVDFENKADDHGKNLCNLHDLREK
ncbi:hypothetical protein KCF3NO3_45290 [Chryseobacterium sp. KCF3-3]